MNNMKMKKILLWALACLPLLMTIIAYPRLPAQVPLHWDIYGQVNRVGDKFPYAFLLPAISLLIPAMMNILPRLDPRGENYSKFTGAYYWMRVCIVAVFTVLNTVVITSSLGFTSIPVDIIVKLLIGILIMVIGNLMPKIKHNFFVGIRTPWTINNEDVWFATHRHAGPIWFVAGIIMAVLSFIPGPISAYAYFGVVMLAALEPMAYSYIMFSKYKRTGV